MPCILYCPIKKKKILLYKQDKGLFSFSKYNLRQDNIYICFKKTVYLVVTSKIS